MIGQHLFSAIYISLWAGIDVVNVKTIFAL